MALNEQVFGSVYNCYSCTAKMKKKRGCMFRKKRSTGLFPCICGGKEKCSICGGSGEFKVHECPRGILRNDYSIRRSISSFFYYVNTEYTRYPDGKALYYQPLKMLDAFEFLSEINQQQKKKQNGKQD